VTTKAWFFPIQHTTDAFFRAWGSDLSASFAEVGLVKTADTGQIDWTTVLRPTTTDTAAGYEIWRYTDSTVFLKIEYGTRNSSGTPGLWLTVGQGSNGSGTLTGAVSARTVCASGSTSTLNSPGTSRQSFLVYKDGFFGFVGYRFGLGAGGAGPVAMMAVARTTNSSGAPDSRGVTVYWKTTSLTGHPVVQAVNFQTGVASPVNTGGSFVVIPMGITSSIVGSDTQCFIHWTALPLVLPNPYAATTITSEVPAGSTFTTTLIGTTPRTYLVPDSAVEGSALGSAYSFAMLWE
jgi:hypothetical protein